MSKKTNELFNSSNRRVVRLLNFKEASCEWCGLGRGCNVYYRRKYYGPFLWKKEKIKHPNWKMFKIKKQWQKPKNVDYTKEFGTSLRRK